MRHSRFVNPACLDKQMGRLAAKLFLTGKFLPNYVEVVFASRRLPPKAAVSACRRHSFVEGIRNGGLDFVKAAAIYNDGIAIAC